MNKIKPDSLPVTTKKGILHLGKKSPLIIKFSYIFNVYGSLARELNNRKRLLCATLLPFPSGFPFSSQLIVIKFCYSVFILSKGELYKTTNSFTTAFFVSSCFVLVGVSIIYIVQRFRPELVRKREPTRQEVYDGSLVPTPSIHSVSVVDTLSGMFVTEPGLSASHLDPMEVGSYQRFDNFRREESRATFQEPVHGRMANPTEIEAVYRQAVDNLSNVSGVTDHHRNASDTSGNFEVNVPTQSRSASIFSGSIAEMPTVNVDSSTGLQIPSGETKDLPKASESCATLVDPNTGASPQGLGEVGINISGDGVILQGDEQQEKVSVASDRYSTTRSPTLDIQTALEAKEIENADTEFSDLFTKPQSSQVAVENNISLGAMIVDDRDIELELEIELVKLPPPPEIHRKRKADPLDTVSSDQSDVSSISSTDGLCDEVILKEKRIDPDAETIQDSDQSVRTPLIEAMSLEREESAGNECINGLLELVRIPPPPSVPRTGQLVALEGEANNDGGITSLSEVKSDIEQDNQYDKEAAADDNSSCRAVSTTQRKERLHLAIIDQLNLLSERLEAVAARQIQEEEEEHRNDDQLDQRPPFSPALQSLPLTPIYSANHSVPLTPACAWSSCLNTPAPTPRQTPPSAFLTTAPTPIHTPHTPALGVSGICTPSDLSMANPSRSNVYETGQANITDSNKWNDGTDVCSLSPSQDALSRQRSRCSSFSEAGQEFVLNEWSVRDPHGSTEAFSSKPSSGNNSSVSNSARSIGDLNSVSEPFDIVEFTINESHRGHMNSPENYSPSQEAEVSVDMCLPRKPCLNYENTDVCRKNLLQQSDLNSNLTDVQTNQMKVEHSNITQQLAEEVPQEELFSSEMSLVVHTCQQLFTTTDPKENELEMVGPTVQKTDTISNNYQPESTSILSPEVISNTSTTFEPQQKIEYRPNSRDIQMQQTRIDPSPLDSDLNSFLESDQKEFTEFSQCNPFQQPPERLPDESQNPFQIPGGLDSHDEQSRSYQSQRLTTEKEQYVTEQMEAFSLESRSLTQLSPKLNSTPQATDSHFESYCAENVLDQHVVPQRSNFTEENFHRLPEESDTGITEAILITSENPNLEADQEVCNRSQWTIFSPSEECLIFEMETEIESSLDSGARPESNYTSASSETNTDKKDHCAADQENLFPPLQIFSDVADMITKRSGQGVPVTLPPPPKQAHRKRVDTSFSVTTELSLPHEIGGKDRSKQKPVVDKQTVEKIGLVPVSVIDHERHGSLKVMESGSIETHHVPSDEDLSATGNSFSEIESDLISESKLDELPNKLSDNSICGIVCQELESINDEDEMFASEKADDSNIDGEMVKTSFHNDIAPLLAQSSEPIQYVNLGDLPEDVLVLHKRPSSTSSTDDSSTSTESSLSENEMPYSKLHEDTPAEG